MAAAYGLAWLARAHPPTISEPATSGTGAVTQVCPRLCFVSGGQTLCGCATLGHTADPLVSA